MENKNLKLDTSCRLCGSDRITPVLRLTPTPLEDQFVREEKTSDVQPTYPLELAICDECAYVHLPYIVSPEASYQDYVYVSGVTVGLRNHYDAYAADIVNTYNIPEDSLAVDIGSNDGSMLASFKRIGLRVAGVEPAQAIAEQAHASGLPTINGFFSDDVAGRLHKEYGPASVVTANYMYANVDDIIGFTKSVAGLLAPDGIFIVQTGYHPEQMKKTMFDYIYHEHFSYFTVAVLQNIFNTCGLELIQATKISPKGGSIRIVGQLAGAAHPVDSSVAGTIAEEGASGVNEIATFKTYARQIDDAKTVVCGHLEKLRASGKKIVGLGASHSTTTLTYHFGLRPYLEYLVDDNQLKHGLYSPGYHIPVYPTEKMYADAPDCVIVLAWQHAQSILHRHRSFLASGGQFVVPLPKLEIIHADHE